MILGAAKNCRVTRISSYLLDCLVAFFSVFSIFSAELFIVYEFRPHRTKSFPFFGIPLRCNFQPNYYEKTARIVKLTYKLRFFLIKLEKYMIQTVGFVFKLYIWANSRTTKYHLVVLGQLQ